MQPINIMVKLRPSAAFAALFNRKYVMNGSDIIASLALITSFASVVISYRAMKISHSSQEFEAVIAFENDKSELLLYIEQSRNHFTSAVREIERLKFAFESSPFNVREALESYQDLFSDYLPRVVMAERQASSLWEEVYAWRDKSGRSAFAHKALLFRSLVDNDRFVYESAMLCVSEVRSQLERAKSMFDSLGASL